jgi:hypothetical protein
MGYNPPSRLPARGGPIYLLREEKWSAAREKRKEKRRKRRTIRKGGGGVFQNVGREEGASERDAREKTRLKLWREKDGAVLCRRRRGER